jgi:hypothetical protein
MRFDPDKVRRVDLWWWETRRMLTGIEIFDKNNNSILKAGSLENDYKKLSVVLAEGERIVGISSLSYSGLHIDF